MNHEASNLAAFCSLGLFIIAVLVVAKVVGDNLHTVARESSQVISHTER